MVSAREQQRRVMFDWHVLTNAGGKEWSCALGRPLSCSARRQPDIQTDRDRDSRCACYYSTVHLLLEIFKKALIITAGGEFMEVKNG